MTKQQVSQEQNEEPQRNVGGERFATVPRNKILLGDARTRLAQLPTGSIDCVVTSPPYFQLRDYGVTGQMGLEPTIADWIVSLRLVTREIARVLAPHGGLWLNLGDSFSRHQRLGAPPKSLLLAPERFVLALAQDGWIVRNKVVWAKPNPMPSSVRDRLSLTYEMVYFLVRNPRYYFDLDAIRELHRSKGAKTARQAVPHRPSWAGPLAGSRDGLTRARAEGMPGHRFGKNPGDVWSIATHGFRGAHFATFPPELVRRPILASCPLAICTVCEKPYEGEDCGCGAPMRPGVVCDPFFGAGTVGLVARDLCRDFVGIELNPAFLRLAEVRLGLDTNANRS